MTHSLMQPGAAPGIALANKSGIVLQQNAQRFEVSGSACPKELGHIRSAPPVNLSLQRSPARKAVLASNGEVCVGEFRSRVRRAQREQTLLGDLLQKLQRCAFGKISTRHRHLPSIRARRPRLSGWKSGSLTVN